MNINLVDGRDEKRLCRTLGEISWLAIVILCLLILLFASCLFKIYRVIKHHTASGLAFWHLFLNVLFTISQFCLGTVGSVYEFNGPWCTRYVASLGIGALSPLFLFLMCGTIVACALIICFLKCAGVGVLHEHTTQTPVEVPHARARRALSTVDNIPRLTLYTCMLAIAAYILFLLVPSLLAFTAAVDLAIYLLSAFWFLLATLPFLAFGQFVPEMIYLWRKRDNIRDVHLDCAALAIDAILFTLLGISWRLFISTQDPLLLHFWYALRHPFSWQMMGSLLWFNYVLLGLGQGLVLAFYLWLQRLDTSVKRAECATAAAEEEDCFPRSLAGERTPLLRNQ